MKNPGIPIVGFSAWSGTGKTTLLRQIIPELKAKGLRVAVIKHAHHHFDLDQPGKDSYELRKSGANHTIICTTTRMAAITEFERPEEEPSLEQIVARLDTSQFDILLVEGYKHLAFFAKIELHRAAVGKPYLYPEDESIVAIASDNTPEPTPTIPVLDINNPSAIAEFIYTEIYSS
jgi:molybdopterin-guanine dinucleotide biosynthesis protein MobB